MMKKLFLVSIFLFACSIVFPQVLDIEYGKIEFIGLKSFSAKAIVDSLSLLHPGKPIHACAGSMKKDFGFAEVSSLVYPIENRKFYYVITIIENDSAKRISYVNAPKDFLETFQSFNEIKGIVDDQEIYFSALLKYYRISKDGYIDSAKIFSEKFRLDTTSLKIFCQFLKEHQSPEDLNLALWLLNNDSNLTNNKVALAILTNFDNYDIVWWTLMNLQRSKNIHISMDSIEILRLLMDKPRNVNWSPAVPAIKSILAGSNLFAYWSTLELLVKTNISFQLANQLLKDNKDLLIDYLNAQHMQTRNLAVQFIKHISNNEVSDDPNECKEWLLKL